MLINRQVLQSVAAEVGCDILTVQRALNEGMTPKNRSSVRMRAIEALRRRGLLPTDPASSSPEPLAIAATPEFR